MTTPLDRVRTGDWRTALTAAVAALLAAIVAAQLVATSFLLAPEDADVPRGAGMWLRLVCGLVGTAFWAPVRFGAGDEDEFGGGASASIAPLTITLAALVALYVVLRRSQRGEASGAWELALRAAAPFAVLVALVTGLFGRYESSEHGMKVTTAWVEPLLFALVLATLTGLLAYRDVWKPFSDSVTALRGQWEGPARVAAYALGVGLALSSAAALLLLVVHGANAAALSDVLRSLPAFLGVVLNVGIALFGIASGGRGVVTGAPDYVALYKLYHLSPAHWLLVLIPVVTVVLTARWAARRGGVSWARVVALVVAVWFVLAWASRARFTFGMLNVGGQSSAGASLLWGSLALAVWFGVVAPLVAPYVTGNVSPTEAMTPDPRPRRETAPNVLVTTLAVMAILWAACGAVIAEARSPERPDRIDQPLDGP